MRLPDFDARYNALVDTRRLAELPIDVIGCGTIGRPLTLILAAMGAERLTLWDNDRVNPENLGNQGWSGNESGDLKVDALTRYINDNYGFHPSRNISRVTENTDLRGDVRFYCVDSVEARRAIAQVGGALLHIDGRIGGEKLQIVCRESAVELESTIPEANGELPCGQQSTLYIGHVCAGLMVSQMCRWLRGDTPSDVYQHLGHGGGKWGFIA